MRGSKIRQCMSNGNWSGDKTYCEGKKGDVWKVANIIIHGHPTTIFGKLSVRKEI